MIPNYKFRDKGFSLGEHFVNTYSTKLHKHVYNCLGENACLHFI